MSYEEARRDRRRSRRNQNLSLILGLLSGVGRTFMQQKQAGDQRKWTKERDALKEQREMERMRQEQEFRSQESALNRQNQLDIADKYANRQNADGRPTAGVLEAMGIVGDMDVADWEKSNREREAAIRGTPGFSDFDENPELKELIESREKVNALKGYNKWQAGRQTRPQADRTGDLTVGSPSLGPVGQAQQVQGQRQYQNLTQALRGAYAGNDPMAWETIRQTYPSLNIPPYNIASPDLFGQGMPQ